MKVEVVTSPEGKHPVRIGEILDKTRFDLEQGTAVRGRHVIYHWYVTQERPIPLKRSMRLIPTHKVSTRRARTR